MKISELSFKNILSYGNITQTIQFDDKPKLILVEGENGAGKCLHPNTEIEVLIEDPMIRNKFIEFLNTKNNE